MVGNGGARVGLAFQGLIGRSDVVLLLGEVVSLGGFMCVYVKSLCVSLPPYPPTYLDRVAAVVRVVKHGAEAHHVALLRYKGMRVGLSSGG